MSSTSLTSVGSRRNTLLSSEETELWELCYYGGVMMDPQVFRVVLDLLHMGIHPNATLDVLKKASHHSKYTAGKSEQNSGNKDTTSTLNSTSKSSKVSKQPSKQKSPKGDLRENQTNSTSKNSSSVLTDKKNTTVRSVASSKSRSSTSKHGVTGKTDISRANATSRVQSAPKK
ncbi:unnamed protein product [Clavelina lepadiformis]|uniref:Mitotic-spindle organizing protein 2-like n=1 Tax=Clavelina lepadiformis TaxID=159417 RepID=A0ABP0GRZ3_CLALP